MPQPNIRKTAFGMECNIPWEDIQDLRPGCKFCAHCSREIVDYRKLSLKELNALSGTSNVCGVYDFSQFAYEVKLPSPKLLLGLLIPIWLTSEPSTAIANNKPIEMTNSVLMSQREFRTATLPPAQIDEHPMVLTHGGKVQRKRRLYISKRFPFIHIRKRLVMTGRYF